MMERELWITPALVNMWKPEIHKHMDSRIFVKYKFCHKWSLRESSNIDSDSFNKQGIIVHFVSFIP